MKNKLQDTPYCGVRAQQIASLPVESVNDEALNIFLHLIRERYKIHLRKDVKQIPPPFTKDPILRQFRFTNVRREHDKETLWVIENITSNPDLSYEDKLLNCFLFRLFNKHETAELLGMPIHFSKGYNPEDYRSRFIEAKKEDPNRIFFTGVFYTTGMRMGIQEYMPEEVPDNSMEMRVMYFLKYLQDFNFVGKMKATDVDTPEAACELLKSFNGIGQFLSYQVFVDMTYIEEFPFSENEYTIAGPGAKKGLKFLFDDTGDLTPEELIFWLRDHWNDLNQYNIQCGGSSTVNPQKLFRDLPEEDRVMNVMSIENCLCEFSKYYKATHDLGRPRQKYKGGKK